MSKVNLRAVGTYYEKQAVNYLRENGYVILEQNYRIRQSEIDIIGKKDGTIVFVEVKYRKTEVWGVPREAVNYQKQKRISMAAAHYLTIRGWWETMPCRFDVIEITDRGIQHLKDAFMYTG